MVGKSGETFELAMRLGRNIAARRKQLPWTQGQLAECVEVDAETISRFELGVHLPSLPTLYKLASIMHVGLGDLTSVPAFPEPAENRQFVLNIVRECCEHLRNK